MNFTSIYFIPLLLKGSSQMVDSGIYIWSTKLRRFKLFQNIMTTGAYDWTYFSVNGYHFLAAAQAFDGFSTLTDSRIYVLQDKQFVLFQTMEVTNFIISLYSFLKKSQQNNITCIWFKNEFKNNCLFKIPICLKIDFLNIWQMGVTIKRTHILIIEIIWTLLF